MPASAAACRHSPISDRAGTGGPIRGRGRPTIAGRALASAIRLPVVSCYDSTGVVVVTTPSPQVVHPEEQGVRHTRMDGDDVIGHCGPSRAVGDDAAAVSVAQQDARSLLAPSG